MPLNNKQSKKLSNCKQKINKNQLDLHFSTQMDANYVFYIFKLQLDRGYYSSEVIIINIF